MSLRPPKYIPIRHIEQSYIKHTWNDSDPYRSIEIRDVTTEIILDNVSNRGITAFSIGCAEWVVYRFAKLLSDLTPYDYIETYWLYVMGEDRAFPPGMDFDDWLGPIRSPMCLALVQIENIIVGSYYDIPSTPGARSAKIALHVLIDKAPFLEWQKAVLDRLVRYFPRDEGEPDGPFVPREILDPSVDLTSSNRDQLIEAFLRSADYKSNPFIDHLRPPNSHAP